jgi:isoleucyl-tRNA synthetase
MPESVHLCDWPMFDKRKINQDLENKMDQVRATVNLALAERTTKAIKVKQPLAKLKVSSSKFKVLSEELLDLIKDEVNIKEVIFDGKINSDIELDTNITEELREEGVERELVRAFNDLRKEAGLKNMMAINLAGAQINLSADSQERIKKQIYAENYIVSENVEGSSAEKEVTINGQPYKLYIKI